MRWVAAILALAIGAGAAGCGKSEEEKARDASQEFLQAVADQDATGACKHMAPSLKRQLFGRLGDVIAERPDKCAKELKGIIGRLPVVNDPHATSTRVTRADAVVQVAGKSRQGAPARSTVTLRKSQKEWLVTDF